MSVGVIFVSESFSRAPSFLCESSYRMLPKNSTVSAHANLADFWRSSRRRESARARYFESTTAKAAAAKPFDGNTAISFAHPWKNAEKTCAGTPLRAMSNQPIPMREPAGAILRAKIEVPGFAEASAFSHRAHSSGASATE